MPEKVWYIPSHFHPPFLSNGLEYWTSLVRVHAIKEGIFDKNSKVFQHIEVCVDTDSENFGKIFTGHFKDRKIVGEIPGFLKGQLLSPHYGKKPLGVWFDPNFEYPNCEEIRQIQEIVVKLELLGYTIENIGDYCPEGD